MANIVRATLHVCAFVALQDYVYVSYMQYTPRDMDTKHAMLCCDLVPIDLSHICVTSLSNHTIVMISVMHRRTISLLPDT